MKGRPWPWPRSADLAVLCVLAVAVMLALKIRQFLQFQVGFELADYETVLWNTLHGRFLQVKCASVPFLAEHFSPVLLLILPLYALVPSPWTLIVLQAVACAAAVIPLYLLAARFTTLRWPPLALGIAYAASRTVNYGLMYDFHPEILYPLLFFSAFLALERNRVGPFALLLALAATVKEDAWVAIAGLGVYLFVSGQRARGIAITVAAVAGLGVVMALVLPLLRGQAPGSEYRFASYWSGYGATRAEIVAHMLDPRWQLAVLFRPEKLPRMFNLFSVHLFLPLASGAALVGLVLPNWFVLYSSDNGLLNGPILYYGLLITPFLFYASLVALRGIGRRWPARADTILLVATTLMACVQLGNTRLAKQLFREPWRVEARYRRSAAEVLGAIPPGAAVSAQNRLCPHVPVSACRNCFPYGLEQAEYVALDARGDRWPSGADYAARVDSLERAGDWSRVIERDGFRLLRRTAGAVTPGRRTRAAPDSARS